MSVSLIVLIPLAVLAGVLALCFVGCTLDSEGVPVPPDGPEPPPREAPFTEYSTVTVLEDTALVSYWPLGEDAGATTAIDTKAGHNGSYLVQEFPAVDPAFQEAFAPGEFSLGNPGIVPGDIEPPHEVGGPLTTCMDTNGGYVSVEFHADFNPLKAEGFTLEAWVGVGWTEADPAFRNIITSLESIDGFKGFALFATDDHHWGALIGNGGIGADGLTQAIGAEVLPEGPNHLVATYDGDSTELVLYLNGVASPPPTLADYHPATANPLYIGAGRPDLPEPHYAFHGKIQCVAIYTGAMPSDTVAKHFKRGMGDPT